MFKRYLFLFLLINYVKTFEKCCNPDNFLSHKNSTSMFCKSDEDKRVQIYYPNQTTYLLNNNNILSDNFECVDVLNKTITKYTVNKKLEIIKEKEIDVNYFRKCCPLNFHYNSISHSCKPSDKNNNASFITQHFVKIGLPNCRVIRDYKLSQQTYRFEVGSLFLHHKLLNGQFCLDQDESGQMMARGCEKDLDVCKQMKCLHKCCPDGQSFVGNKCINTYKYGMDHNLQSRIRNSTDPYVIIHNYDCRLYILKDSIQFYIDENGVFWAFYNKTNSFEPHFIDNKSYCVEHVKNAKLDTFKFFMCFPDEPIPEKMLLTRWIKIISCIFITLTIIVYYLLPEMMNLFGKILISYCFASLTFFCILTYSQFITTVGDKLCVILSFVSVYTSLTQFTWLNVMCFNIWWTFGSNKVLITSKQKRKELKKFLLYSLYGWGAPLCLTFLIYLVYHFKNSLPYSIQPHLGHYKCFWEKRSGNYGSIIYYTFPIAVIEIIDIVLFFKTIVHCLKIKNEIKHLNDNRIREKNFKYDSEQLNLIIKLSVTMGISFIFEVVSSFYTFSNYPATKYIEIVWDSVNCLQGVFIFIIFVCKQRVLTSCKKKFVILKFKRQLTSATTCTTEQESLQLKH